MKVKRAFFAGEREGDYKTTRNKNGFSPHCWVWLMATTLYIRFFWHREKVLKELFLQKQRNNSTILRCF